MLAAEDVESEPSPYDVSGDLGEGTVVAERVRAQSDQRVADGHVELGGDHARSLMYDEVEVSAGCPAGGTWFRSTYC